MRELKSAFPETLIYHCELLCARVPHKGTIAELDIMGCSVLPVAQETVKSTRIRSPVACMYGDFDRIPLA